MKCIKILKHPLPFHFMASYAKITVTSRFSVLHLQKASGFKLRLSQNEKRGMYIRNI